MICRYISLFPISPFASISHHYRLSSQNHIDDFLLSRRLLWLIMAWYFPWITPVATISNHWPKGIPRVSQGYQLHSACTAETSRGGDHWTAPPSSLPSRSRSTKATCDLRCRWPVPISPGKSMGNSMAKVGSRAIGFMIYLVRWGYIKHQKKLDDVRWGFY